MKYARMPIEIESPESLGYGRIDCNLAESSVKDVLFKEIGLDLQDLVLAYGDHLGKPELRELIAGWYPGITSDRVLMTVGAAGALFLIHSVLLSSADHLVVVRPNYGTNIETPRAIGAAITFIDLHFEDQFALDTDQLAAAIRPNTRLISVTTPHNPTGTTLSEDQLIRLCALAEKHECWLLVDETYRDLSFNAPPPFASTISPRAISVCSVSKAYGIPGIRLGWVICQHPGLNEQLLAAKEQIHISNSVVDEEIAWQYLRNKERYFPRILARVKANFESLDRWMSHHPQLEWVKPSGGVVCFPRFRALVELDTELFYELLLKEYKTYLGPGHWFEQSRRAFRLGFGWEDESVFSKGLNNIDQVIQRVLVPGSYPLLP